MCTDTCMHGASLTAEHSAQWTSCARDGRRRRRRPRPCRRASPCPPGSCPSSPAGRGT
uniref:Uncharacterized protein n=1 Tax=Arundo donax TaxID=35708 RepID=A0A0A9HA61_ARUDO